MLMNPMDPSKAEEAYESYGRKVNKCQYCDSYNVSLDSSSGKIVCNNPNCSHKNKQDGKQEDFDKKIMEIHDQEKENLIQSLREGTQVDFGDSKIHGINDEPGTK